MNIRLKKIATFILCLGVITVKAQSGFTGTAPVFTTTSALGLNTAPVAGTQLSITTVAANSVGINVTSPNNIYGSISGVSVAQPTVRGDIAAYVGNSGIYSLGQSITGIAGSLSSVNGLSNFNSTATSNAFGGSFVANVKNPVAGTGTGLYNIAGISGLLTGITQNYGTNVIMAAGLFEDKLDSAGTYAGYFKGKGYFTGKVKIGNVTTTPGTYKLYVKDGILTEKVKIALASSANWADYVFAKDYKLKPLVEVENFLINNKHLPNMPSAQELVNEGGIDVNQMFAKQMEKIEELTLYIIQQNKEIEDLKIIVAELQKHCSPK